MSENIEVGKTYIVKSSRKGTFTGRITHVGDTFADVLITQGRAGAMLDYNERETGETVTVRKSFCTFTPVEAS